MPRINEEVADAFEELADLLQIADADRFRIVAYRRVAAEIRAMARDLTTLTPKEVGQLKGVGKATAAKINELITTGKMAKLEEVRATVPPGIRQMTALPGLGPKTALALYRELGISSLAELEAAIKKHRLRKVKGMGKKTEDNLAASLKAFHRRDKRAPLDLALSAAERMVDELGSSPLVEAAAYCGSLRRMKETIGDLDLLAATRKPAEVMELFGKLPGVTGVAAQGPTKTSVSTKEGLQVDLRVVAPDELGAALQYFTGSQEHNVRVREIAVKQGYKLSEYGLFRVQDDRKVAGETEDEIYHALGMQTPPPTMRENRGEVELSLKQALPKVVELDDIRGDLHSHSTYSDGQSTVREMALQAAELGRRYLAVTDHFLAPHVRSNSVKSLRRQSEEIAALNDELRGRIRVLLGVEVDIDYQGGLALPDEAMDCVDVVVASIHQGFSMPTEEITQRVLRALNHPRVNVFGHPTGRRIGSRTAADLDLVPVFQTAARNDVALEVNSNPSRLDLKDDHLRLAKEFGCSFCISTDAHSPVQLSRMRLGVGMAQRGWVTAPEVINCLPLADLQRFLRKSPR
jgi:DNA polymerase (family 10)